MLVYQRVPRKGWVNLPGVSLHESHSVKSKYLPSGPVKNEGPVQKQEARKVSEGYSISMLVI